MRGLEAARQSGTLRLAALFRNAVWKPDNACAGAVLHIDPCALYRALHFRLVPDEKERAAAAALSPSSASLESAEPPRFF
jgi:hypothetical protein